MEFIPRVTPRWVAPVHLKPYIDVLNAAPGAGFRIAFAAPPQHSKSESAWHAFVLWSLKHPELRNAYATYSADRAGRASAKAAGIAERAGLNLQTANLDLWRTKEGGQTLWTSVGGPLTGEAIDGVLVIDDSIKDRKEAESVTIRSNQKDWYHSVAETRLHPGASVIAMMTRWHSDDLVGYLVKECGFTYINLKAIADERRPTGDERQAGDALWPWKHPLDSLLAKQRANTWNFTCMYQGEPRPRGGALFRDPTYYTELPTRGFRVVFGLDLSYTEKTHADFSVCVEIWCVPPARGVPKKSLRDDQLEPSGFTFYVVDVQRKQVEAPAFTLTLKKKSAERPSTKFWFYAAGTEKGGASFIAQKVPLVIVDPAGRDKYSRAQQTSMEWNIGAIMVPSDSEAYPWVDLFVDELTSFTGVKDVHDDQVDALVSGIDAAIKGAGADEMPDRSGGRYSH